MCFLDGGEKMLLLRQPATDNDRIAHHCHFAEPATATHLTLSRPLLVPPVWTSQRRSCCA